MLDVLPCEKADACMHTKTQDATACSCISFFQKIDLLWTKQCMCVRCLMPVMGYVDKVNLNGKHNHKPGGLESDSGWGKEKMFIHPQLSHQRISARFICVCLCSQLSVCFQKWDCVCVSEFVVWIQLSGWLVKSLTASLWLVRTGRQHHPGKGEKRTETQDWPGLLLGRPTSIQWLVEGGARKGGQLLSPLMSLCFFHQLSIYRAVQHSCAPSHPSTHIPVTHTEAVLFLAGDSQE